MQRRTLVVDDQGLLELHTPHDGIVREREVADGRFEQADGPFVEWDRHVTVVSSGTDRHEVSESVAWRIVIPVFGFLITPLIRRHVRRGLPVAKPWWAPTGRLDARAVRVIGLLGVLAVVNGYVGTVIGQTLTFAADEFCGEFALDAGRRTCIDPSADTSVRADIFTIARISIVLSLALTVFADRQGRRRAITIAIAAACGATALGALAPSLWFVAGTQIVARGLATGMAILILVVAAEELPPRSRAYGVSILVLLAGLGSGMVVWVLPLADLDPRGWRIVYAIGAVFLPFAVGVARRLPTTRRFAANAPRPLRESLAELGSNPTLRKRLLMLAAGAALGALFSTPASQFDNQFLRDELGFSAARISLFTVTTSTPIGIGVLAGGVLADRFGRRPVGAIGTTIGAVLTLASFFSGGISIWFIRAVGVILGAGIAVPALSVYGPELFPTRLRSTANGLIIAAGVMGSVIGLQLVGRLAESLGGFGPALACVIIGPLLLVVLIITVYPETASMTLEELNDEPELDEETGGGTLLT